MDERCKIAHAKMLAGTCPWCGCVVINGHVGGETEVRGKFTEQAAHVELREIASLRRMVVDVGPLECRRAAGLVAEVARELTGVHNVASFHGGVRPDKIFIDQSGVARLGGTKPLSVGETADNPVVEEFVDVSSIADYLAPELAITSFKADLRSDIYSLGCTFYFLLTGRPPYSSGTLSEKLLMHQTAMPESIAKIRPEVPLELIRICEKMLAKRPNERYETTQEVIAAIANWRAKLPRAGADPD